MPVKSDHREDATRPQEITEARKGWSQREVVQGPYSRDEVEAIRREGMRHHVALDKHDAWIKLWKRPGMRQHLEINVNADHAFTPVRESSSQETGAASNIKCAPAEGRN